MASDTDPAQPGPPPSDPEAEPPDADPAIGPARPLRCGVFTPKPEWIDYNGHMNVGYYSLAFDQMLERAYETVLGLDAAFVAETGMGPFALQTHLHYLRELKVGDRVAVDFQLLDLDAKRWRYVMTMTRLGDGSRAATAEQISMNVDHATRRSAPMDPRLAERLAALFEAHRGLPTPPEVGAPLLIRRSSAGSGAA